MVHYYQGDAIGISLSMSQTNSDFYSGLDAPNPSDISSHAEPGLAEVLQNLCQRQRSGQITFRSAASHGYVFLQQGQVVHAMCGTVEGEEAVYLMLSWPPGTFVMNDDILPHKRSITLTWEQLLFEGARRADVGAVSPVSMDPIVTAHPLPNTRPKDNQPKLIISHGDGPPLTVELQHEYTHLGRADDNELSLPEPSISSRHCVFVLSGSDVIVRDLNSSNGTYVNGEQITETILRPGDNIQVGVIDIKFVPGVRRPKLNMTATSAPRPVPVRTVLANRGETTLKLPSLEERRAAATASRTGDDHPFVSGSAISYEQLAPDAPKAKSPRSKLVVILTVLILLVIAGAAAYFVFVLKR
jgi:pSer/pThr/pTyr-binding forkhead associated (FHA) protein